MHILFCGLKNEYGKPENGLSFEYQNFYKVLAAMEDVEVEMFAMDEVMAEVGRDEMNQRLINIVDDKKPDLLFCFLFTEELKKETIKYITKKTSTKTFNWFADDHWRFPIYSRFWASLFTTVSTTDSQAIKKYHSLGINNVVKTQWAANIKLFRPVMKSENQKIRKLDISFVGKKYGNRGKYIQMLKKCQLPIESYGLGWSNGIVSFEEMVSIFSNSKINLNFTESAYGNWTGRAKMIVKLFLNLNHSASYIESFKGSQRNQIKGRTFEIPACAGFLLTANADNLKDYYENGKEIVVFNGFDDLAEKCKYYLENEEERKVIARAGYERTIKEHSYAKRFAEIFEKMELT